MKKVNNLFPILEFGFTDEKGNVVWKEFLFKGDELQEENLYLICEEEEEGVEEGCSPWPWVPCVYPPGNSKRTYKVTRRWYGKESMKDKCKSCEEKAELQKDLGHGLKDG